MELTIKSEQAMPLMDRKDVIVRVHVVGATPSRDALRSAIAKELKSKLELTIVHKVEVAFGEPASLVHASVYGSEASIAKYESAYMRERNKLPEAPAKEEAQAPAEEAAAEPEATEDAPAEETKEAEE